jgi:VWFA-related protein
MPRTTRHALLLGIALLPTLSSAGQTPSFRAGIDLIEVTAVVRDRDGTPIRDLTQADFQILERGIPQQIVAFDRVSIRTAPAPASASASLESRDVASNEAIGDRRVFVLVLDALHVASSRTLAVRQRAAEFIERYVGPADMVAVVSPGGPSAATQDFTADKARLIAAVQQFVGNKMRSATVEIAEEQAALDRGGVAIHDGKDPSDSERAGRARALADVLEALGRHLARVAHRRTTMLLFSEGIEYDVDDVLGRVQRYSNEVSRATERAVEALMRSNVSMYAIDPRGLGGAAAGLVETPLFAPTPSILAGPSVEAEYSSSIRSLREVSGSTGGFAAVDRNDLAGAFDRIVEDSSDYFVLGYAAANPGRPGEFRDITVKVERPGARVVARKGYVVPPRQANPVTPGRQQDQAVPSPPVRDPFPRRLGLPAETPAPVRTGPSADLGALLASPLPASELPIRIQAIPFRGDARKGVVDLVVEVLGKSLRFAERSGRFEERIELALLTVDEGGRAANGRSATFDLHLPPDQYQRVKATGIRWLSRLELPPARYQLRVAARAVRTGVDGLVTCDLDVLKFEPERFGMSGVTITSLPAALAVTQGQGRLAAMLRTPTSAARTFVSGDHLTAAVEVYVPISSGYADVEMQIDDAAGVRRASSKRSAGVTVRQAPPNPVVFAIDTTELPPGRYVMRIAATPGSGGDTVQRHVPFEVVVQ